MCLSEDELTSFKDLKCQQVICLKTIIIIFKIVNTRVKCSKDGQYIYTAGCYKPTIKCFETSQLSLKFERCVDYEVIDMHILTDDYQKLAILGSDRTIEFHTSQGKHAKLRIPKFGREIDFYPANSEVLVASSGNEVYRISLEEGRFLQPYTMAMDEAMSIAVSQEHYLVALGTLRRSLRSILNFRRLLSS